MIKFFIYEHYNNLPQYVAFIHGHENAWHQSKNIMDVINEKKWLDKNYFSLNNYPVDTWNSNGEYWPTLRKLWPVYFKDAFNIEETPDRIVNDCCAQFVVSRAQILKHPRETYKKWLDLVLFDYKNYDAHDQKIAVIFEYLWHIIFGQPVINE